MLFVFVTISFGACIPASLHVILSDKIQDWVPGRQRNSQVWHKPSFMRKKEVQIFQMSTSEIELKQANGDAVKSWCSRWVCIPARASINYAELFDVPKIYLIQTDRAGHRAQHAAGACSLDWCMQMKLSSKSEMASIFLHEHNYRNDSLCFPVSGERQEDLLVRVNNPIHPSKD